MKNKKKHIRLLVYLFTISFFNQSCSKIENQSSSATEILSNYYKNKYIDKAIILDENHRMILDTIVVRLTETEEPQSVIQYIVNDYKLKYGTK